MRIVTETAICGPPSAPEKARARQRVHGQPAVGIRSGPRWYRVAAAIDRAVIPAGTKLFHDPRWRYWPRSRFARAVTNPWPRPQATPAKQTQAMRVSGRPAAGARLSPAVRGAVKVRTRL